MLLCVHGPCTTVCVLALVTRDQQLSHSDYSCLSAGFFVLILVYCVEQSLQGRAKRQYWQQINLIKSIIR